MGRASFVTHSAIGSGSVQIITEYRFSGLSRQARGVIDAGIHVIPYLLFDGDMLDVMKPRGP